MLILRNVFTSFSSRYHPYGQGQSVQRGDAVTGNPRPPQYLSRHAKVTATTLAEEAKETIKAVRKMLQIECKQECMCNKIPLVWDIRCNYYSLKWKPKSGVYLYSMILYCYYTITA